jgi:hypothetical protein
MMKAAKCNAIRHDRFSTRFLIRNDMRRLEKLTVPQFAEGAGISVGLQDPFPESTLMQSLLDGCGDIGPSWSGIFR